MKNNKVTRMCGRMEEFRWIVNDDSSKADDNKHITEEDFITRMTFVIFWTCYLFGITWAVVFLWRLLV